MTRYLALRAGIVCLLLAAPAIAADNELTPQERADGWQLLFNGRDTTGWKCNNDKPIATKVEDGSLVPYKSGGYLIIYDKPFGDFILKCDVKMGDPQCNSGIFFRVGDPKNPVYTGLEVQVFHGRGTGMHDFGALYDLVRPSKNNIKPDDWNAVTIKAQGPLVTVWVNGEEVSKLNCDEWPEKGLRPDGSKHKFGVAIKDMPRSGYLGFQDHEHMCWYKNVKLRELKGSN
ncbi:MAG: DUF1080 domain-containing protein [Planctomycetia bacterium]|nr:DUF1080 domain-containing protein [Planctomycetia bacterium]